jgi:PEP-CTERM motif
MKKIITALALTLVMALASWSPALADTIPLVDGRYTSGEGYTTLYDVSMDIKGGGSLTGGQLWVTQDSATKDLYLALILPTSYVDNTYGANAAPDWNNGHKFSDLLNSDMATFQIYTESGKLALTTSIDYLVKYGPKGGPNTYAAAATDTLGNGFTGGTQQVATSLQYNLDTVGQFLVDSSLDPGWINAVIYELQIDGSLFAKDGFSSVALSYLHASPSKVDASNPTLTVVPPPPGGDTPEPATMLLMGSGLLLVGRLRKRWAKK